MINLIDADSILYLSLPKKLDTNTSYEYCIQKMNNLIKEINYKCKTTSYILFITKGKCFRYKDYKYSKNYKHNRSEISKPPIFYALKEYMVQKYDAYSCKDLEADDLVSYFHNKINNTIISSIDKDVLYQNIGTHYNYSTLKFIDVDYDMSNRFFYTQLIMGDSGDGIAGVEGVGIKTVNKLFDNKSKNISYSQISIEEYINKYGIHEGIHRFYETFNMIYLLKTDYDMEVMLNYLPKMPIINKIEKEEKINISKLI